MIAKDSSFYTGEAAFAVDSKGRVVVWNSAAKKTFGYTKSEALGMQCWKLLSGRDVFGNRFCCKGCPIMATAFSKKPINRFEIDFQTASRGLKKISVSAIMLFNSPQKVLFVHLCQPEPDGHDNTLSDHTANRTAPTTHRKALTARETETLILLHKGMTIAEIAIAMGISTSTVRNHTQHILLKLQVHSRFEAVALGRKLGLI